MATGRGEAAGGNAADAAEPDHRYGLTADSGPVACWVVS